ncbi:MAG: hypothetical protein LBN42_01005, partial [Oscillospiraceae bacterium]|nr:hypothetical protein [Oscillospiraceae bacterium]
MTAFHTISSAPHRAMTDNPFAMNAEDLYTAVISALKWRQKNGRIALYCDNAAYEFITQNHLAKIWDEVYNT